MVFKTILKFRTSKQLVKLEEVTIISWLLSIIVIYLIIFTYLMIFFIRVLTHKKSKFLF